MDTGAPLSLLYRDSAQRIGLDPQQLAADPRLNVAGTGPSRPGALLHVLTPVTMGELTIEKYPVAIVNEPSVLGVDMLLGLDLLSRVHPWFSFSSHMLILQVPPSPSRPSPA